MALIVRKYGGSSLANTELIKSVARGVASVKAKGNDVVIVVSAMANTTDELISLANQISERPAERELDRLLSTGEIISSALMAMVFHRMGHKAISLTGAESGIKTDAIHGRATVLCVESKRVAKELANGNIVIVAGFLGITEEMEITTLGRGGSDTTAVMLAISLGAEICEIYTDVNGVYTADPRLVPEARLISEISYEEMLEMASSGAVVIHPRAVELAWHYEIPILVASSFNNNPGTIICRRA